MTFELSPRGRDVVLTLTHRRIERDEVPSVAGGWHTHLGILVDRLNGRTPAPFWATHARLKAEYARRMP